MSNSTPHNTTHQTCWPPEDETIHKHLRRAQQVALESIQRGAHPFGCILVAPDNTTVLLEQGNIDVVNHAEAVLCRRAYEEMSDQHDLSLCTLYTTVEPCCMCAGTQYWAGIGRVVFGMTEDRLLQLTGDSQENPTMRLSCREVFARGQKEIRVVGPIPELEDELVEPHKTYWKR